MSHDGGELGDADRIELERAFARIGDDSHRRRCKRGFQLRVGEVGQALEDREVGHDRQRKARKDDRLAADLVRQPAEHDEERRAEQERSRDQDLRR